MSIRNMTENQLVSLVASAVEVQKAEWLAEVDWRIAVALLRVELLIEKAINDHKQEIRDQAYYDYMGDSM